MTFKICRPTTRSGNAIKYSPSTKVAYFRHFIYTLVKTDITDITNTNCSTTARNTVLKGPQHGRKILLHFICVTTTRPVASIHIPLVICTLQCAHLYIQPLYILVTPTYISVILTKCSISEQIKKVGGGGTHTAQMYAWYTYYVMHTRPSHIDYCQSYLYTS